MEFMDQFKKMKRWIWEDIIIVTFLSPIFLLPDICTFNNKDFKHRRGNKFFYSYINTRSILNFIYHFYVSNDIDKDRDIDIDKEFVRD